MFQLFDSHCHIHDIEFDADRDQVLARARAKQIGMIVIGTSLADSEGAIRFAESQPDVWATVGLHPEFLNQLYQQLNAGKELETSLNVEQLRQLIRSSKKVVAIGECGLDAYRLTDEERSIVIDQQEVMFRQQIDVALELDLPVVIHCREALLRLATILQSYDTQDRRVRGVVHSFTGTWDEAQPLLDLGMYIGINGIATFPLRKGQTIEQSLTRTIERMPLNRMLLETDAPYLAPIPFRGQRNEPGYVERVAEFVARARQTDLEGVAEVTTRNVREVFSV